MQHDINGYVIHSHKTCELTEEEYAKLAEKVRSLYLWFAPDSTNEDIYQRFHRHPETRVDLLIDIQNSQHVIGFSAYQTETFDGSRVMFRGGTIVSERSHGFYKKILEHGIRLDRPDFLVAMTQNPRVYEALSSFSSHGQTYPSVTGELPSEKIQCIAKRFCKAPNLDPKTFLVPNVYDSIKKDESFKTGRNPAVQKMFAEQLHENDGFLVVVPL